MSYGHDHHLYCDVDFRPSWYLQAEHDRQVSRWYRISAMLLCVVMVVLVGSTWRSRSELSRYHASQVSQIDVVNTKMTQIQKLQREQVVLRTQMKVHEALYQPLEYNQVLSVLASFLPESVALRDIELSQRTVKKTRAMTEKELAATRKLKTRRAMSAKAITTDQEVLELEIKAVAASHMVIANLIGDLAASEMFEDVKMLRSQPIEIDGLQAHNFSLRMLIPLDRHYRFVDSAPEVTQVAPQEVELKRGVAGVVGGPNHVK